MKMVIGAIVDCANRRNRVKGIRFSDYLCIVALQIKLGVRTRECSEDRQLALLAKIQRNLLPCRAVRKRTSVFNALL